MTAERPPKREHGVRQTRKGTEIVSRYETLRAELGRLRIRQAIAVFAPAAATALLLIPATQPGGARLLVALGGLTVLPLVLHRVWRFTFPTYRAWSDRSSHIRAEIADLQERIAAVFNKYRERQKGERFKQAYDLMGRSVRDLEEALSIGMFRERREIFVTAFMRGGVAVRVTASIGSPFRCSAADNPARWKEHVQRFGCDEIRQYHNHPVHGGSTQPSPLNVRNVRVSQGALGHERCKAALADHLLEQPA